MFGRAFMLYGSADNQNDQDLSEMGVPNVKMIVHLWKMDVTNVKMVVHLFKMIV